MTLATLQEIYHTSCILLPILLIICLAAIWFKSSRKNPRALSGFFRLRSTRPKHLKSMLDPAKAHGIIFGKKGLKTVYSEAQAEGHCLVIGGSGSGKTSTTLLCSLKSWIGSSLTIDISGDIHRNLNLPRMLIYEPLNPHSIPYSVFDVIDGIVDISRQDEELALLAHLIMPEPAAALSDAASYFENEGRKLLKASLVAFYHVGLDFIPICRLIHSLSFEDLIARIHATKNSRAVMYINSFHGVNEKNSSGAKQALDRAITLFATNDALTKTVRRPKQGESHLSAHKIDQHNAFVVIPDERLALLSPLLRVIVSQSLNELSRRPLSNTETVLLCLDEFASFGKLEMLDALRKLRKRHVRIMILTQSLVDIDLVYGTTERIAMLANFKYMAILGVSDRDTQKYFSDLVGTVQVPYEKSPTGYVEMPAMPPHELGRLRDDMLLIHPDGHVRLKKIYYFKCRAFK